MIRRRRRPDDEARTAWAAVHRSDRATSMGDVIALALAGFTLTIMILVVVAR
jgi:hypothetical protein